MSLENQGTVRHIEVSEGGGGSGGGGGGYVVAILSDSIVPAVRARRNGGTKCRNGECVYSAYLMSR